MTTAAVVAEIPSLLLVVFGLAVASDFRGLASRISALIAGRVPSQGSKDRLWSILPLSLGLGVGSAEILTTRFGLAATVVGVVSVAVYYVAMMRLAWLYTPPVQRRLGPLFWTMRAAAIPAAFFFAYGGLLALIGAIEVSF